MNEERNSVIGQELQNARLDKGLSLDDIQQSTKIQKRYLAAIENGQFDQLPGAFYERAFVRQYASAVGLDVTEFMQNHDIQTQTVEPDLSGARVDSDNVTRAGMHHVEESTAEKTRQMLPKILIGVAVVAIIGIIWALVASFAGSAKQENTTSSVSVTTSKVSSSASSDAEKSSTDASKESAAKSSSASSEKKDKDAVDLGAGQATGNTVNYGTVKAPANKELTLNLKTTGASWIQVSDASGAVLWNGTLQANGNQDVKIPATVPGVRVSIGNAAATAVSLDGKSVDLMANNATVWNLAMTFAR
ncbi:helix-turn-helix domain-containing protein [Weissella cibaria]|uniref:Helix-turn-helix domain-containing protein n=1 Tax=Weissella cibaria TaxID=137591 RepID=A0A1X4JN80_9LACO|nr:MULTISPECIES: helix-turn-helix domain-containing protein [Weissella]APS27769.1 Cytoskeleton protein RodZ [Weissella cibaria]APU63167.1 cytoskeletal protein RodZ [Weissella cibaria]APU65318.1 cytoskeletal protein RodZ [Weissella cibaria]ASS51305.1 Cytoskeleton protein RodZ [Weissella cibaria]KXU11676.1 Transcriptional regulator in cluster with unspecified monosaccharide ABC transport system [Weissella sp. DD23]